MTAKQEITELLERLPGETTLEDIQYHLYVREKVQGGLRDADEGRTITQEEAEKRMSKWLNIGTNSSQL